MRDKLWFVARWLVGIGILAAIAANIEFGRLARFWEPDTLLYVGGAAVVIVGAQLVSALRWNLLLEDERVAWSYLARLYLIGNFFSAFLPTSIGGDAIRTGALAAEGISLRRSVASVLLDRILGVAGMVPLFAGGALLMAADPATLLGNLRLDASPNRVYVVGGAVLAVGAAAVLLFRRRLWSKVVRFGDEFRDLAGSGRKLVLVLTLGVCVQAMYVGAWWTLVPATGLEIGWAVLLFAVPVVSVAAMLPVTIAGLGVREGVWVMLLGGGFAMADVVAYSLLYFVAFCLAGLTGGVLYVLRGLSASPRKLSGGDVSAPETIAG